MKKIPLYGKHGAGKFALVDDEDYDMLMEHKWFVICVKACPKLYYARYNVSHPIYKGSKPIPMHRVIMGVDDPKVEVDHIDGNGLNNQRSNLRLCSRFENCMNRKKRKCTSSKYKGVAWRKDSAIWRAYIRFDGKLYNLGQYDSEVDAALAYNQAALMWFGQFASINKIE